MLWFPTAVIKWKRVSGAASSSDFTACVWTTVFRVRRARERIWGTPYAGCAKLTPLSTETPHQEEVKDVRAIIGFFSGSFSDLYVFNPLTKEFPWHKKVNEQPEKRRNPAHVSIKYSVSLMPTYQSSLLKTMNPLLPLPKATWLLPLSHQFVKGWPSTTLRNITMFLKTK